MNKKHWNTVELHGRLTLKEVQEMIDHSYELVFNALPKAERMAIQNQGK
jgi:predicted DNA-binding protein (MmcQ/YjbR family)